jgi:DNA-binding beta-propeller fold protein YncE
MVRLRHVLAAALALAAVAPAAALAAPAPLTPSTVGEDPNGGGVLRFVQAVAFSPGGGTLFAADQYSGIVQAFGRDGAYKFSFGSRAVRREPGRLGTVGGLATDRSGHLYVLDSENDRVQVFDAADGRHLASFGDATVFDLAAGDPAIGAGISASGLAVDQRTPSSPPVVFVADQGRNRVARFTLDLATLLPAGPPAFSDASLGLLRPQGIALDQGGTRVYVADDQNDRVVVLDPQSLLLVAQVGSSGSGPGQFQAPYDVAVDSHQPPRLYVGDNLNNRVDVFDAPSLGFLGTFGRFGRTPGLFSIVRSVGALTDDPQGGVAVADTANNRIHVFSADGVLQAAWGLAGRSAGYFTRPRGVAFAPDGAIAVADSFNHRIARIDADGTFSSQLGLISAFNGYATEGSASGQFSLPSAVTFDSAGHTVVADTGNDRVVVFGADGAVLRATAPGQLADPQALTPGPAAGSVFVADTGNGRVVLLAADGTVSPTRTGLSHPIAVAAGGASKVYAADDARVLDAVSGTDVAPPLGAGAWDHPDGLAVDPADGTLYVSELRPGTPNGARVLRGTPGLGGTFTWDVLATEGASAGQVIQPGGLALSPDRGTLLVADYGNDRVLRLDAPGHGPAPRMALTVAIDAVTRGTVTSNPLGIACATDCVQHFGAGRAVTLTAAALPGSRFAGWTGACAAAGAAPACTIAMDADRDVGASFAEVPAPAPAVTAPPPPPPPPRVTVTKLRIVPPALHRARKADGRRHVRARRATHAKVSLTLSRPAKLTVTIAAARKGVRRGSQCIAPPRRASGRDRACTRFVTRNGTRTISLAGGARSFTLTPVFAGRTLAAGAYRLDVVALDAAGNRVGPTSARFRVVR